jgi:hypothetical protein
LLSAHSKKLKVARFNFISQYSYRFQQQKGFKLTKQIYGMALLLATSILLSACGDKGSNSNASGGDRISTIKSQEPVDLVRAQENNRNHEPYIITATDKQVMWSPVGGGFSYTYDGVIRKAMLGDINGNYLPVEVDCTNYTITYPDSAEKKVIEVKPGSNGAANVHSICTLPTYKAQ